VSSFFIYLPFQLFLLFFSLCISKLIITNQEHNIINPKNNIYHMPKWFICIMSFILAGITLLVLQVSQQSPLGLTGSGLLP